MTEELKTIAEIFANVTDGALVGGISFLTYQLITDIVPWVTLYLVSKLVVERLPRIKRKDPTDG